MKIVDGGNMAVKLTEVDKYRIALKLLIYKIAKDGIPSEEMLDRDTPNLARQISEDPEHLMEFNRDLLPEIVRVRLGCEGVTLHWQHEDGRVAGTGAGF